MNTQSILYSLFNSFEILTAEEAADIASCFRVKTYPKGKILLGIGEINDKLFFIEEGITREFSYLDQDQDITHWLMSEGDFQYIVDSFIDESPSKVGIEVLEKARIWILEKKQLEDLYQTYPKFNIIARLLLEQYLKKYELYIQTLRKPAEKRLEWFYEYHPHLANRIPLKYVASYLQITPTHLSRIRQKLMKIPQ